MLWNMLVGSVRTQFMYEAPKPQKCTAASTSWKDDAMKH